VLTIEGFDDPLNDGEFTVTQIISVNEEYEVTKVSGNIGAQQIFRTTVTISRQPADQLSLLSGNPGDDRVIGVYYDVQTPRTDPDADLDKAIPLPGYLHHAALAGTNWYANRSVNDRRARSEFRRDFDEALSDGIKAGRLKANRPQQMPMSIGRMW
jgi:hypothetical protein